jgi:hypothetical protein
MPLLLQLQLLTCSQRRKETFQDGELLKEAFLTGADCLSEGFSNKREIMLAIQDLQLSDITVTN